MWAILFPIYKVIVIGIVVLLHEGAHVVACNAMGIKVTGMRALPWGVTADAPLMYEPGTQLAVSLAGPMCNFFLLIFTPIAEKFFSVRVAQFYVVANLANGILNLLPALPLDGGIVLKAFLCARFGFVRGFVFMIRLTGFMGFVLMIFGLWIFSFAGGNASYLVAGAFIVFNLRHEKELVMCIKKRILTGEIRSSSVTKEIRIPPDSHGVRLVDFISPAYTLVFNVVSDGISLGKVSQGTLLECILKNTAITAVECIEKI